MLPKTHVNRVLRWLLQVDRPVPPRTDAEISAEVDRNYRWNFTVNLLDVSTFLLGLSFISSTTIVPLYVSKLTDSPLAIGLAAVIAQGAWFLPQLFTANAVERLARKKPMVVNLGLLTERLPMWLIVISALVARRSATAALILFFWGYAWHGLGAGLVATAWQDLIARCFPVARRGRFMGMAMFVGTSVGAVAAGVSAWLLRRYPFPTNFIYSFTIAAAAVLLSTGFLALTREPVQPVTGIRQSNRQFWAGLPQILRQDHNFRRFLTARLLLALTEMGTGFVTVTAVRRWSVADSTVGVYTAVFLIGQTAGNLIFGFLADRFGHKLSLEVSGVAVMAAFGLAWLAPSPAYYFAVFALLGVYTGARVVSGMLVVMEFSTAEKRPTYMGLVNTAVGLVSGVAPLLGAGLVYISYKWLFSLSAAAGLVAFVLMRWWVQEPRYVRAVVDGKMDQQAETV